MNLIMVHLAVMFSQSNIFEFVPFQSIRYYKAQILENGYIFKANTT